LAINGGSSSIRFAMYDTGQTPRRALAGKIDRIGPKGTRLTVEAPGGTAADSRLLSTSDHRSVVSALVSWLEAQPVFASVRAVGHRVVHGMRHSEPARVTSAATRKRAPSPRPST
jgi:acetate kinase